MHTLSQVSTPDYSKPNHSGLIYVIFAFLLYGFFSDYFVITLIAGLVLALIIKELFRPFIPAALLYLFIFQWAQVFMVVPFVDSLDSTRPDESSYLQTSLDSDSQLLVIVTLLQLAIMAWVAGRYLKKIKGVTAFSLKKAVLQLNTKKVIIGFFVTTLVFPPILALTGSNPSIYQLVQSAGIIRQIFLLLLIFILLLKRDSYRTIIIVILIVEFLLGFTGFFSSFKDILLCILIAYLTVNPNLKMGRIVRLVPIVAILVLVLSFWSYVKPGYRAFISGGARQQVVVVSRGEALNYLWDELSTFDSKALNIGSRILMERVESMKWYFKVYKRIPSVIPFQDGENIKSTITFLLLPRSLNPDKGILDPSLKTTKYSGVQVAAAGEGTSIAMGYFVDFFIDYGLVGMTVPLILLACLIGWGSKKILMNKNHNLLFKYALLISVILSIGSFDNDLTFFLGAIRNLLVLLIVGKWLFTRINKYVIS